MKFSEAYDLKRDDKADWFDPILNCDTHLFVDPFLIFKTDDPHFRHGHAKIMGFFERAFHLCAEAVWKTDVRYRKLEKMLVFPEMRELCIGYSNRSVRGSGTARVFARAIAATIDESISRGIKNIRHFEETGLFEKGIGADRISDATGNILVEELVKYTQDTCNSLKVPLEPFHVRLFDYEFTRWQLVTRDLPKNPVTGESVLLVPQQFLRDLPMINYLDFRDWIWDNQNETLRDDLNYEVKSQLKKKDIVRFARERRDWVNRYVDEVEKQRPVSYDLVADPKGLYIWDTGTSRFVQHNPIHVTEPSGIEEFTNALDLIIGAFKVYAENMGCDLLWNGGMPKPEAAAQKLFYGVARGYCVYNNIDVSREIDLGCGSVDFKFSNGFAQRAILEVKLVSNGKFWSGLEKQLPTYQEVEGSQLGYFMAVAFTDDELNKTTELAARAKKVAATYKSDLRFVVIDARKGKPTASKL